MKLAKAETVEFLVGREGHVVDIEVEPHADRVGRDEVIDVARSDRARPGRCGCAATSAPSTTAAPPLWRRISSAIA